MTQAPQYYYARDFGGYTWRISRDNVIADMHEYNPDDEEDQWPDPMTEECIEDWLGDNADNILGWELVACPPTPTRPDFLTDILFGYRDTK